MIRGTGDNGGRDFCLYPGQRHCQVQQHYTQKEKKKRAAAQKSSFLTLKHSRLLLREEEGGGGSAELGVHGSQLTRRHPSIRPLR